MTDQHVIRYKPDETDLQVWDPMESESLLSGNPVQRGCEYFRSHQGKLHSGIWDCTAFETRLAPYDVHEFMLLLEGSVTIIDADNKEYRFHQGQGFVIPKGLNCRWKQDDYVKKFYVILEDASDPAATGGDFDKPILLDPALPLAAMTGLNADDFIGDLPEMSIQNFYQDAANQFNVGVWESTAMTRVPGTIGRSELMHIVSGQGEVVNGDGVRYGFGPGDTFMVPINMGYQWVSEQPVKKIFCSFAPG